jgi:hypothetical protein
MNGIRAAVMIACAVAAVSCSSTTSGVAVKAPDSPDADGAVVALLDTGAYATAAGHPFGTAGDDLLLQATLEAQRIAEYTVGPWQVDTEMRARPDVVAAVQTGPISNVEMMRDVMPIGAPEVAAAHRFITGFTTMRVSTPGVEKARSLQNVVLRFPDPAAADAAAREMAAKSPGPADAATPGRPTPIWGNPDALAASYNVPRGAEVVQSFTPHGPFVLFQHARADRSGILAPNPEALVQQCLDQQKRLIDEFTPTDAAKLADLPKDPTGQLLARTLWAPDGAAPFYIGSWQPRGWLHFEDNPVSSTALFDEANVDAVSQRLTTVYEAGNAEGAGRIVDAFAAQIAKADTVKAMEGVPGLPTAKCFVRMQGAMPPDAAFTWRQALWQYKCVARAERYAYTAFSNDATDVRQQISAQYRILAGQ